MDAENRRALSQLVLQLRKAAHELHGGVELEDASHLALQLIAVRCLASRNLLHHVVAEAGPEAAHILEQNGQRDVLNRRTDQQLADALERVFDALGRRLPRLFRHRTSFPEGLLRRWLQLLWQTGSRRLDHPISQRSFADSAALGWSWQAWNSPNRKTAFEQLRRQPGSKFHRRDQIPATLLYSDHYMVRFLLENSLGIAWAQRHPDSPLIGRWRYLVRTAQRSPATTQPLRQLTLLDPACGAGHFLVEAFEMLFAMYSEVEPDTPSAEIGRTILAENLTGIDIDERAIAVAEAALWMRAVELAPYLAGAALPMNLCVARSPSDDQSWCEWLRRAELDQRTRQTLAEYHTRLACLDEVGSLLRPRQALHEAARKILETEGKAAKGDVRRLRDKAWEALRSCNSRSSSNRSETAKLLEMLDRRFEVVVTNPPFMGSRSMRPTLKRFLTREYAAGKRDLYAAFILRCCELARPKGRVAMVTQQSWMFLRSFAQLRAASPGASGSKSRAASFRGILHETTVEALAHLGTGAFEQISGEVVSSVLFVVSNCKPVSEHQLTAVRLVGQRTAKGKQLALLRALSPADNHPLVYQMAQLRLANLPHAPMAYWVDAGLLELLERCDTVEQLGGVKQGLATGDNARFVRLSFECSDLQRWKPYAKGGGLRKWCGLQTHRVDWHENALAIRNVRDAAGRRRSAVRNEHTYFESGITYTLMARGALGLRLIDRAVYDVASMCIFPDSDVWSRYAAMAALNTRPASYLARLITQDIKFNTSYVTRLPLPPPSTAATLDALGRAAVAIKRNIVRHDLLEDSFQPPATFATCWRTLCQSRLESLEHDAALLHTLEAAIETCSAGGWQLTADQLAAIYQETGAPSGKLPLLEGDTELDQQIRFSSDTSPLVVAAVERQLQALPRTRLSDDARRQLACRLLASNSEDLSSPQGCSSRDAGILADTGDVVRLPIPSETRVEALSHQFRLHPFSIAGLLKQARTHTDWPTGPAEQHVVSDHLTTILLQMFGHRWPSQIESGVAVSDDAELSGIIPLVPTAGYLTLIERVEREVAAQFGSPGPSVRNEQFLQLMNCTISTWLTQRFFPQHIRRFKRRPILWQLQSGRWSARRNPAFSALIYYHRLDAQLLETLRDVIIPRRREMLLGSGQGDARAIAELDRFVTKLNDTLRRGFAGPMLQAAEIASDKPPVIVSELAAYRPDLNDGVRVNIAPLQKAGLLAAPVLAADDVERALDDRFMWRTQ